MIDLNDQALVMQALAGQASAWEELFARHRASLRSLLNCRNAALADDILQETFIKAYLNLEKYDPQYSFVGWLWVIARNLLVDQTRKNAKNDECLNLEGSMAATLASGAPDPEQQAIFAQNRKHLEEALGALSDGYREILVLRFWHDLPYEAIAQKLDMPIGTVKTKIHRARAALIALL